MQALLVQLDAIFLQEHICSAAPTVVEDYKGTAALNRELEVIFLMQPGIVLMLDTTGHS